jgi:hypothetical protein
MTDEQLAEIRSSVMYRAMRPHEFHEPSEELKLLAEIDRLRGERQWQPMATAPKDGTPILLTGDAPLCVGPFIGAWDADPEYPDTWATGNCRTCASAVKH